MAVNSLTDAEYVGSRQGHNLIAKLHTSRSKERAPPWLCPESEVVKPTQKQEASWTRAIQCQTGQGHTVGSLPVILLVFILTLVTLSD